MYKIIECELPLTKNGEALIEVNNTFRVGSARNWKGGRKHKAQIPQPIRIDFEPFRDYPGPPMEYLDQGIPIMSRRLSVALQEAGVNNIDFYDVILRNSNTKEEYQYKAFNIIGKIAIADLASSEYINHDGKLLGDVGFKNLVIDEQKANEQFLFRLAENINAVMVHEKIIKSIKNNGIETLSFIEPNDWVQL